MNHPRMTPFSGSEITKTLQTEGNIRLAPAEGNAGLVPAEGNAGLIPAEGNAGLVPAEGNAGLVPPPPITISEIIKTLQESINQGRGKTTSKA